MSDFHNSQVSVEYCGRVQLLLKCQSLAHGKKGRPPDEHWNSG
jgi:hypothetical protein